MRTRWSWAAGVLLMAACVDPGAESPLEPAFTGGGGGEGLQVYSVRAVPRPCPDAGHRQFDFWVGEWNVQNPTGALIATSVISSELDGCVIMEDYIANGGFQGRSMSMYDDRTGRWYQTFVDNVLAASFRLEGDATPGSMLMSGAQNIFLLGPGTFVHREVDVTWTANPDGTVRQTFVASFDGAPATVTFDGVYLPAEELDRAQPFQLPICTINAFFRTADFWLGMWSVSADPGTDIGTSTVVADMNGCLIQEDFEGKNGYLSRSFLYFDFAAFRWFRTFMDNLGNHVELVGDVDGAGRLVMMGEDEAPDGSTYLLRVTLEPSNGGVLQTWETSSDDGATWKPSVALAYAN